MSANTPTFIKGFVCVCEREREADRQRPRPKLTESSHSEFLKPGTSVNYPGGIFEEIASALHFSPLPLVTALAEVQLLENVFKVEILLLKLLSSA